MSLLLPMHPDDTPYRTRYTVPHAVSLAYGYTLRGHPIEVIIHPAAPGTGLTFRLDGPSGVHATMPLAECNSGIGRWNSFTPRMRWTEIDHLDPLTGIASGLGITEHLLGGLRSAGQGRGLDDAIIELYLHNDHAPVWGRRRHGRKSWGYSAPLMNGTLGAFAELPLVAQPTGMRQWFRMGIGNTFTYTFHHDGPLKRLGRQVLRQPPNQGRIVTKHRQRPGFKIDARNGPPGPDGCWPLGHRAVYECGESTLTDDEKPYAVTLDDVLTARPPSHWWWGWLPHRLLTLDLTLRGHPRAFDYAVAQRTSKDATVEVRGSQPPLTAREQIRHRIGDDLGDTQGLMADLLGGWLQVDLVCHNAGHGVFAAWRDEILALR